MAIPEKTVAAVVKEASQKMSDPSYAQVQVGSFVQQQRAATEYVKAHVKELGSAEAVVSTIFHAALIGTCFQRASGRSVRAITFAELDRVSEGDREAELRRQQPALWDFLHANVESQPMRDVLIVIALGMDYVS